MKYDGMASGDAEQRTYKACPESRAMASGAGSHVIGTISVTSRGFFQKASPVFFPTPLSQQQHFIAHIPAINSQMLGLEQQHLGSPLWLGAGTVLGSNACFAIPFRTFEGLYFVPSAFWMQLRLKGRKPAGNLLPVAVFNIVPLLVKFEVQQDRSQ
jgi:hypothetical protein